MKRTYGDEDNINLNDYIQKLEKNSKIIINFFKILYIKQNHIQKIKGKIN